MKYQNSPLLKCIVAITFNIMQIALAFKSPSEHQMRAKCICAPHKHQHIYPHSAILQSCAPKTRSQSIDCGGVETAARLA